MLTQQILGTILICLPIIYVVCSYNQNNSIKDKFVIRTTDISFAVEKNVGKLYLTIECENLSNQVIHCFANLEKSNVEIKTKETAASLTQDKDELHTVKHTLL